MEQINRLKAWQSIALESFIVLVSFDCFVTLSAAYGG